MKYIVYYNIERDTIEVTVNDLVFLWLAAILQAENSILILGEL